MYVPVIFGIFHNAFSGTLIILHLIFGEEFRIVHSLQQLKRTSKEVVAEKYDGPPLYVFIFSSSSIFLPVCLFEYDNNQKIGMNALSAVLIIILYMLVGIKML